MTWLGHILQSLDHIDVALPGVCVGRSVGGTKKALSEMEWAGSVDTDGLVPQFMA